MATPKTTGLRMLMLHGYTQSGPLFRAKTRALEKALTKAFPHTTLCYPTAPLALDPAAVPGLTPAQLDAATATAAGGASEAYAWWRRRDDASPVYDGFEQGLAALAAVLAADGPFDGVIGFSQGGAAAAMLAALLDAHPARRAAFAAQRAQEPRAPAFPDAFLARATGADAGAGGSSALVHPPLRFAVVYSGFAAPAELFDAFYAPRIRTPTLHVFGGLDTVVAEARGQRLVEACEAAETLVHPGGHFVPSQRLYLDAVVSFVRRCCAGGGGGADDVYEEEAAVEDMDVPFGDHRL